MRSPFILCFQSQRTTLYQSTAFKLLDSDHAYRCFCSPKRLEMLGRAQKQRGENPGYDKKCRTLTSAEIEERLRRQEPYMIRFKVSEWVAWVRGALFIGWLVVEGPHGIWSRRSIFQLCSFVFTSVSISRAPIGCHSCCCYWAEFTL